VKHSDAMQLQRGDLVLDVVDGELYEFLWTSGYNKETDAPFHIQLRPLRDRADYSYGFVYPDVLTWRYVALEHMFP
jgi:hypothetical protein